DVQDCQSGGTGHRIATKRIEILHAVIERCGDLGRRHYRTERMSITDRFPHRDNVRYNTLSLESPEVCTDTPGSDLDLIRNADSCRITNVAKCLSQIIVGKNDLPCTAQQGFDKESRWSSTCKDEVADHRSYFRRVFRRHPIIAETELAAVTIRDTYLMNVRRHSGSAGAIEFVRTDFDQ